jgi:alanine racemase
MTTKRTNTLGLLLPQDIATALANPFYTQFTRGVGRVCGSTGMTLMLVPPLWGSRLKAIPVAAVDGFIVVGLEMERGEVQLLRRRQMPFVIVDSHAPEGVPSVNVDDRTGAQAAMEYVLASGHRQITIVCIESGLPGLENNPGTVGARLAGYRDALAACGISPDSPEVQIIETPSSWEGGQSAFEQIWKAENRPTAIVAMSDIIAIGIIDAAGSQRVRLPEQLSIVGFDDLPDARFVRPALTTVRQPVEEKGRIAAEMLVAALNEGSKPDHCLLPTELIIRESVAEPATVASVHAANRGRNGNH